MVIQTHAGETFSRDGWVRIRGTEEEIEEG